MTQVHVFCRLAYLQGTWIATVRLSTCVRMRWSPVTKVRLDARADQLPDKICAETGGNALQRFCCQGKGPGVPSSDARNASGFRLLNFLSSKPPTASDAYLSLISLTFYSEPLTWQTPNTLPGPSLPLSQPNKSRRHTRNTCKPLHSSLTHQVRSPLLPWRDRRSLELVLAGFHQLRGSNFGLQGLRIARCPSR